MPSADRGAGEAPVHAVAAEFEGGAALLAGVRALAGRNLGCLDAHSPVPIPGMGEALGFGASSLSIVATGAAFLGFAALMAMCAVATAAGAVFDIGGRPLVPWPAFVVPSAPVSPLASAVAAALATLCLDRLPRLNHPAFDVPDFARANQGRFILTVSEEGGVALDPGAVEAALDGLDARPSRVTRVPR